MGDKSELAARLQQAADDIMDGATIFSDRVHGLLEEASAALSTATPPVDGEAKMREALSECHTIAPSQVFVREVRAFPGGEPDCGDHAFALSEGQASAMVEARDGAVAKECSDVIEQRFWSAVDRDGLTGLPSDMWVALDTLVARAREVGGHKRALDYACARLLRMDLYARQLCDALARVMPSTQAIPHASLEWQAAHAAYRALIDVLPENGSEAA